MSKQKTTSSKHEYTVGFRIDAAVKEHVDRLVPVMAQHPTYESFSINPSVVMRMALTRGLPVLEEELKKDE